ncbi:MAG: HAMP domain-containing histidine kinase [Thermoproteota archaeon]|nr:HAMP domain-containing histidine kinase [Thermoproteota archaeon]
MSGIAIEDGRTQVLYGVENALSYGVKFMENAKMKMDITFDHHAPSIVIKLSHYYEGYKDILKRGGKIRCITEITKENIQYCHELLKIVSELRHLDGLKGGIAINESEYMATTTLHEEQPLTEVIYSNVEEVVSQNQYIFDTFWNNSIPAIKKIKEIEEGIEIEFVKVINDPIKSRNLYIKNIKSSKKELLLFIPSYMLFIIQKEVGFIEIVHRFSKNPNIQIKIVLSSKTELIKFNKDIDKILSYEEKNNIEIETLEKDNEFKSLERTAIAIIDRKICLVLELKDGPCISFGNSIVFSIYSNNKTFVSSYIAIFESLWRYVDLSEKFKEINKTLKIHESNLEKQIEYKTRHLLKINNNLEELNREFERKEYALKKTNNELIKNENKKEEFISMIAHELRTPLVPIKGYTEMLLKSDILGQLNEKQKKAVQSIYRNVKKQESLVEDILDVYKLELGKTNLSKKAVIISDLLANVINDSKSIVEEKQVSIVAEINTKAENIIYCDERRLEQVFSNLIKNSIDYVPKKEGKIILMVEGGEQGENKTTNIINQNNNYIDKNKIYSYMVFTIKDNGPGIPTDKIGNLFKKFYQIDTKATRKHAGTGLGLVICKGIIEAHSGKIWVDKSHTKGLSIKFSLPLINYKNSKINEKSK